jgi:hypothetical protein
MKRILLIASALLLTTAVVPEEAEAARRPVVIVNAAPAKVWIPAHRNWNVRLGRFVTVSGQWQAPPRANVNWVAGRHVGHGRNKSWVAGHWAR